VSRRAVVIVAAVVAVVLVAGAATWALRDESDDAPRDAAPAATASTTEPPSTTAVAAGTPGAEGVGDPYFPGLGNGGYDVEHYDLALTWVADDARLEGVVTITATATQDLSRFNLDLAGLEVRSVTVDEATATWERSDRELVVTPGGSIADGAEFAVEVAYDGAPERLGDGTDLFEVGWQVDGREAFVIAEPAGAATFFPVNDHPSDKATYTIAVTAPEDQVVAANGVLTGEPEAAGGTRTWTYEAEHPMASYLVQVAIGDYVLDDAGEVAGVSLRHALHRSYVEAARSTVARTGEMVDLLDDVFGPYPFDVYGVLAVDQPLGFALETQTLTIIGSDVGRQGRGADAILLHELAHQWVGNSVTPATWQDIWLNEGFATYAEWLWAERSGGALAAETARALAGGLRAGGSLDVPPGDPGSRELFQSTVYLRGGMALQALREAIGDDAFFQLLRSWTTGNAGGVVSTDDLVALAEQVSGQQLDALFDDWLYADSLPTLP
jgi:aminopeptidase N